MVDKIRLKMMRHKLKPTDFVGPNMSEDVKRALRVVMRQVSRDQKKIVKKANRLERLENKHNQR